jgi:hypothetical protein
VARRAWPEGRDVTGREAANKALVSDDLVPFSPAIEYSLYSLIPTSLLSLISQSGQSKRFMLGGSY